ncbi:hypothetical protein FACS189418_5600 [Clostridia bacterium]|nr:hypothetical protein FACS189418_5600 [Clostridia bacterium]
MGSDPFKIGAKRTSAGPKIHERLQLKPNWNDVAVTTTPSYQTNLPESMLNQIPKNMFQTESQKSTVKKSYIQYLSNKSMDNTYAWDSSLSKEIREEIFCLRHPFEAAAIGVDKNFSTSISTNATRFANALGLEENMVYEGSEINAFCHTLRQASITYEVGADLGKEFGAVHEENPNALETWNPKEILSVSRKADQIINLLNNQIGITIGEKLRRSDNRSIAMNTIASSVLDEYHENGLYCHKKIDTDKFVILKKKINKEIYKKSNTILKTLDKNGYFFEHGKDEQ